MKKLIILLMFFLFLPIDVYAVKSNVYMGIKDESIVSGASVFEEVYDSEFKENIITKVEILDIITTSAGYYNLKFIPVNSIIGNIELPESVFVQIGEKHFIKCDIRWESLDTIDTSILGRTVLKGDIIPSLGYEFDGGLKPVVEIPFFIYKDEMEPLITAECDYDKIIETVDLIPLGKSFSDYININNTYLFHTEYGDSFYCPVDWDLPDTADTAGKITVKGKFIIPTGLKLKNEQNEYIYQSFYVMKNDDIYLDYIYENSGYIIAQWTKLIDDFDNIKVFYTKDGSQWTEADDYIYSVYDDRFTVYLSQLEPYAEYSFKLVYNGKSYGNINIFTGNDLKAYFINGDKDGGDNKKQELPVYNSFRSGGVKRSVEKNNNIKKNSEITVFENNIEMEMPEQESEILEDDETESISELSDIDFTPLEEITSNKTIISGDKLIETEKTQGDYITFEKDGIALEIPSDFIKDYNINKNDFVAVEINKEKENININIEVNQKPVENIEGAKLRISDKKEKINEIKKESNSIKNTSSNNGFSEFIINKTGIYTADFGEEKSDNYFVFIFFGVLIFMTGVGLTKWLDTKR